MKGAQFAMRRNIFFVLFGVAFIFIWLKAIHDHDALTTDQERYASTLTELKRSLDKIRPGGQSTDDVEKRLTALAEEVQKLQREASVISRAASDTESIGQKITQATTDLNSLREKTEPLLRNFGDISTRLEKVESSLQRAMNSGSQDSQSVEISTVLDEVKRIRSMKDEIESQVHQVDSSVADLKSKVSTLTSASSADGKDMVSRKEFDSARSELSKALNQINALNKQFEERMRAVADGSKDATKSSTTAASTDKAAATTEESASVAEVALPEPIVRTFGDHITHWKYDSSIRSFVDEKFLHLSGNTERMNKVLDAMRFSWDGYKKVAFGHDEYAPVSGMPRQWVSGGMGCTIVDALDTLWLMGLKREFDEGRNWVAEHLNFAQNGGSVSLFETTIRELGGLLGAYELSRDKVFLEKAKDLGDRLAVAFGTPSGIPYKEVQLAQRGAGGSRISLAEAGTLQLEFTYLSYHTGDAKYATAALKVYEKVNSNHGRNRGLYPIYLNPMNGEFMGNDISLDAEGDSFYEYLLKIWLLTGKKNPEYRRRYDEAVENVVKELAHTNKKYTFLSQIKWGGVAHEMGHLSCFAAAMFALGAADAPDPNRDMQLAKDLGYTCYMTYHNSPSGVAAESYGYSDSDMSPHSRNYFLRPEVAESMFVLYRLTGEKRWQDYGWEMFQAVEKHCRTRLGYTELRDAFQTHPVQADYTSSFWFAETLKYYYLLFAPPDVYDIHKYVFNTEAHPLGAFDLPLTFKPFAVDSSLLSAKFDFDSPPIADIIKIRGGSSR